MNGTLTMASHVALDTMRRALGRPSPVRSLVFKVTRRCNLFCEMCYTHEGETTGEVTPEEAAVFFGAGGFEQLHLLRFTGGEPFLRQDFTELCRAVLSGARPRLLYLTTNGTFADRLETWLKEIAAPFEGDVTVQISLDAADELHDEIRQKKGTLPRTLAAAELVRDFARHHPHLSLGLNQTITPKNLQSVAGVAEVAHRLGAQHTVILAQEDHETRERPLNTGSPFVLRTPIGKAEVEALYADLRTHAPGNLGLVAEGGFSARLRNATQSFMHQQEKRQLLAGTPPPRLNCMAAFTYLRLSPEGDITPCSLKNHLLLGNLKTHTLAQIWHSPQAATARREVMACPGCWVECDIIPGLANQPVFWRHVAGQVL